MKCEGQLVVFVILKLLRELSELLVDLNWKILAHGVHFVAADVVVFSVVSKW